jgi:glycosyltransferase involved in cell wall biosynthesis
LIQASDATTLPSAREGLPRSIMESMALGVPVIGSRIRGIEELLAEGAGMLFDLGNIDEFTECIRQLATKPPLRRACAQAGLERVKLFDIGRVLECYERIYSEVLGLKGGICVGEP